MQNLKFLGLALLLVTAPAFAGEYDGLLGSNYSISKSTLSGANGTGYKQISKGVIGINDANYAKADITDQGNITSLFQSDNHIKYRFTFDQNSRLTSATRCAQSTGYGEIGNGDVSCTTGTKDVCDKVKALINGGKSSWADLRETADTCENFGSDIKKLGALLDDKYQAKAKADRVYITDQTHTPGFHIDTLGVSATREDYTSKSVRGIEDQTSNALHGSANLIQNCSYYFDSNAPWNHASSITVTPGRGPGFAPHDHGGGGPTAH